MLLIYTHAHVRIYVHFGIHTNMQICLHVYVYEIVYVYVYVIVYAYVHVYVYVHVYTQDHSQKSQDRFKTTPRTPQDHLKLEEHPRTKTITWPYSPPAPPRRPLQDRSLEQLTASTLFRELTYELPNRVGHFGGDLRDELPSKWKQNR